MELSEMQFEFTRNVGNLIHYIYVKGYSATLGEAWRPPEMAQIYAKEGKGIVDSQHCKRLAIDINLFDQNGKYLNDTKDYHWVGDFWKSLNGANRWGGDWSTATTAGHGARSDGNHMEMIG